MSSTGTGGGGGEYPLQDGFGWTNGVTLKMLDLVCPQEKPCDALPATRPTQTESATGQQPAANDAVAAPEKKPSNPLRAAISSPRFSHRRHPTIRSTASKMSSCSEEDYFA